MDIFSEIRNTETFIKKIKSNSALLSLWDETQASIPKTPLSILTMDEFAKATGIDKAKSYYGFCTIIPSPPELIRQFGFEYMSYILIADDCTDADIAHEIAHLYIHTVLNYPWLWSTLKSGEKLPEQPGDQEIQYTAERIYAIAVHPIIDKLLKKRNLFNEQLYDRIYPSYRIELMEYLKNPLNLRITKNYIIIRALELMLRLPPDMWDKINAEFIKRNSFKKLLRQIGELSQYPDEYEPNLIFNYITEMYSFFNLNLEEIKLELLFDTPIKKF